MTNILLIKTPAGALAPADDAARGLVGKLKAGEGVRATLRRVRNARFHRKAFALFKLAFDAWEPEETLKYKGLPVERDFERFRKDMTILAGFHRAVYNVRGEVRLEAESFSFASMDEERFGEVFRAVLNVVWSRVLKAAGYADEEAVERILDELMSFE